MHTPRINTESLVHWHPHTRTWCQQQGYASWDYPQWCAQHGDMARWLDAYAALPRGGFDLQLSPNQGLSLVPTTPPPDSGALESALRGLCPWRKGPFTVGDIFIDTEWRSDWKWQRIRPALGSLHQRRVLDVGCSNGYHLWRALLDGAQSGVGVEPSWLFCLQFYALQKLLDSPPAAALVPTTLEGFAAPAADFDLVMSMGVLYHRRDPLEHLHTLKQHLRPGGQLLLESLTVAGDVNTVCMPEGRYCRMRNVWFLPSADALQRWCERLGLVDVRIVDHTTTTTHEQRSTQWMPFESLEQALSPDGHSIEGLPPPQRTVISAFRPG